MHLSLDAIKLMSKFILFLTIILLTIPAHAQHHHSEKYYQSQWCSKWGGIQEYKLKDKTRVDCVTKNYAVEFDFAPKWAEAIGQSLYYGLMTGKKPAVILIIEKPEDFKYYYRIEKVARAVNFRLWYIKSPEYVYKNK